MIAVLEAGASALTDADMNQESANLLMLQTRQSLAMTALSISAESARSVLDLF
jgi:flagellin-like hook-associated protein FlgL